MTKYAEKQPAAIVEAEVCFYDIDTVLYGDTFQVMPTPTAFWAEYSVSDFFGYLQDIGRIDYADNDAERVGADHCSYTFQEFWRSLAISTEGEKLIYEYCTWKNNEWLRGIRQPQPAGPEVPSASSREHAQAEAAELPAFSTRSWAEFIDHTENL